MPSLVASIADAPEPKTKDELRSFLGMSEFYHRFVPHFSEKSESLRKLLKNNVKFEWSTDHSTAFSLIKDSIAKATALAAFDPGKESVLTTDASASGLGATLSQKHGQGERVIGFASRALTDPETRYSTIEREALACWWAMSHFRSYLWGAPFTLRTDHRPLVGLLTTKGSSRATPRIENWYSRMLDYQYQVEYVPGPCNQMADCMSRLPIKSESGQEQEGQEAVHTIELDWEGAAAACSEQEWRAAIEGDELLQEVMERCTAGWPRTIRGVAEELRPYWQIREELWVREGLPCRGTRLITPGRTRRHVMALAHQGHKGVSALKRTVRESYWWEGMDKDMEAFVRECGPCQLADKSKVLRKAPLEPIETPTEVWDTVGMDIVGPLSTLGEGPVYAITLIDYTSKWPEMQFVERVDTGVVITFLRSLFAREGCPRHLITDNGVQFCSKEMEAFLAENGVHHKTTSLYHPQCNGLVERLNRTIKDNLQLSVSSKGNWKANVQSLAWGMRTAPNKITGYSPFQLMRGRKALGPLNPGWVAPQTRAPVDWQKLMKDMDRNKEKYKEQYDHKKGVKREGAWAAGDWVRIRKPWKVRSGESKYTGPHKIKEVGNRHARMENGKKWSFDRLVHSKEHEEQEEGEEPKTDSNVGASPKGNATEGVARQRTRQLPARYGDYVMD